MYERSLASWAETLLQARSEFLAKRSTALAGTSGAFISGLIKIHEEHIARSIAARLESYRNAYAAADRVPSEQDFNDILNECKAVQELQIKHSVHAVAAKLSNSTLGAGAIKGLLAGGSTAGHDTVLQDWKVWRHEVRLKQKFPGVGQAEGKKQEKRKDAILPIWDRSELGPDLAEMISSSSDQCPGTLIMVDLDNLKVINDSTCSHDVETGLSHQSPKFSCESAAKEAVLIVAGETSFACCYRIIRRMKEW